MDSSPRHKRHHSTEYSSNKLKNKITPFSTPKRRPGSESDILDLPSGSSIQHQDSIQLAYHHRPGVIASNTSTSTGLPRHIKPVYIWTQTEVQKWLKRHSQKAYEKYSNKIFEHEITGRVLVALNDQKLMRMGIVEADIRNEFIMEILKLRLKSYMQCFKGLENAGMFEIM